MSHKWIILKQYVQIIQFTVLRLIIDIQNKTTDSMEWAATKAQSLMLIKNDEKIFKK